MSTSRPRHADVNARVDAVLKEHEHPAMTDERLEAMRAAARAEFNAALRERGTDPDRFELLVHLDELVGPMAFVVERATKHDWPLPMFQKWLSRD